MQRSTTLFDKVWHPHVVVPATPSTPALVYIDLHLIHEVTSPQAFALLRQRGLPLHRPDRTVGTTDHSTPTTPKNADGVFVYADSAAEVQVATFEKNCSDFGAPLFPLGDPGHGIVHVISPEQGYTQPGMTIVCGDSHTSTHGALGALAFGIGTSEVGYVMATQVLPQRKPKTLAIDIDGQLSKGVVGKDLILAIIQKLGVGGATGHVIEYRGSAIRALDMESRMTVCNMSIEAGARAGMVAPDDTTFTYLQGRPKVPTGQAWDASLAYWRTLSSDPDAVFDSTVSIDASALAPMITYGTDPAMGIPIDGALPASPSGDQQEALKYMGLEPGQRLLGHPVDVVFIGSCTNSRLSDLRAAANIMRGRKVQPMVRTLVVPGSYAIQKAAEAEGLDEVFKEAGAQWREPGCSMCIAMNGDCAAKGQVVVSTSNRNFKGRQGQGARTLLASPLTAAAAAVTGKVTDPRELLR